MVTWPLCQPHQDRLTSNNPKQAEIYSHGFFAMVVESPYTCFSGRNHLSLHLFGVKKWSGWMWLVELPADTEDIPDEPSVVESNRMVSLRSCRRLGWYLGWLHEVGQKPISWLDFFGHLAETSFSLRKSNHFGASEGSEIWKWNNSPLCAPWGLSEPHGTSLATKHLNMDGNHLQSHKVFSEVQESKPSENCILHQICP